MRKLLAILVITLSSLALVTAMNQGFINRIKQDRYFDHLRPGNEQISTLYRQLFIRSDRWGYGDLYGICYLPEYRLKLAPFEVYHYDKNDSPSANRVLYIVGDSFTADKIMDHAFAGFARVIFLDRRFPFGPVTPDPTKQNYLIMEFSELNISNYASKNSFEISSRAAIPVFRPLPLLTRLGNILFNKELNRNIELLLFDDKIFTPFKAWKGSLNYTLFNRLPPEVTVSSDKKRLLLNSTVSFSSKQSVFKPMTDPEVGKIVTDLSADRDRYLSLGFKQVFLSLIPNAVSVYDDKRAPYNHLIERIEARVTFPVIPVYTLFKNDSRNLYSRSDAHWNPAGFGVWVRESNRVLNSNIR